MSRNQNYRNIECSKALATGNWINSPILPTAFSLLIGLVGFPVSAVTAVDGQEAVVPNGLGQPDQPGTKPARPLAISQLKTSGLSATERLGLPPKYSVKKPKKTEHRKELRRDVVIVKFIDGTKIREGNTSTERQVKTDKPTLHSRLDDLKPQVATLDDYDRGLLKRRNLTPADTDGQMRKVREVLKGRGIRHWRKVFGIDDDLLDKFRFNAEIRKKRQSSDLSNYYVFQLDEIEQGELLADRLNELEIVELAYLAPIPTNPDVPPPTKELWYGQDYLKPAPGGIDAQYAWTIPGGTGKYVRIIDIEQGWNLNHEDLPSMFLSEGRNSGTYENRQHGTAVLGVLLARQDSSGVTGIVPDASGGVISVNTGLTYYHNVAEAVLIALSKLSEGDVILIEQHSRGPGNDGDCTACILPDGKPSVDCGKVATEYWNDIFDAVNAATASGIIVVEAAGNGEMNLDHQRYEDRFNRNVRNSGALFVGAGGSYKGKYGYVARKPWCSSNHGSRVDVQGWGDSIVTTGYGKPNDYKMDGADDNQWYYDNFGGTSGASAIVAGAVAAIQGIQIERNNPPLDWYEMGNLLTKTGTPQTGEKHIGPLPDLKAAIAMLPPPPGPGKYKTVISLNSTSIDADRGVSGFKGSPPRTIGAPAPQGAIERLTFGEKSDEPCYVKVEKADIVARSILKPHAELNICSGDGPTDRSLMHVQSSSDHRTFIRGVAVCNSKTQNSTRVKGVKGYYVRVEDDGSFHMLSNPVTVERFNCDDNWHEPAMCPSGTIASDLVVHIRPDGDKEVFTGLSLQCRKVEVTKTCVSGCQ